MTVIMTSLPMNVVAGLWCKIVLRKSFICSAIQGVGGSLAHNENTLGIANNG